MASIPFKITSRHKGLSDDVRIQDFDSYAMCLGFDIFSNPTQAIPYRNTETDTTDVDYRISRGIYYGGKLYGLGRKSTASNVTKIYEKSSNILTDAWTASTTGEDSSGAPDFNCFLEYEGHLFFFAAGSRIGAYKIATNTFSATALNLTAYTNSCQGIVTDDGLLLMPYDNKIAVKDSGSDATSNWETARLTLPSTLKIMDIEEWGDQVAIVCAPTTQNAGHSYLYLWNKLDADISQRCDLGEGDAQIVADIDGELVVVMLVGGSSSLHFKQKIVTRVYTGGIESQVLQEIETGTSLTCQNKTTKLKDQNRTMFAIKATIDSVTYHSLWVLGRKKAGYPILLSPAHLINNDTTPTSVEGAWKVGNYFWFSINSGTVVRTNNDDTYTATATYISQRLLAGDRDRCLKWVGVTCPPLPAGSTISLYYRVNGTTGWTKVYDLTTTGETGHQAGIDASGADFLNFAEIQFKLTTTGGTALPASWMSIEGVTDEVGAEIEQ